MQILIFSLLIIALLAYIVYKLKESFTKKDIFTYVTIVIVITVVIMFFDYKNEQKMPESFKDKYLNEKKIEISKISYTQKGNELLSSTTNIYDFIYIINKDSREYVCEGKNVEVQKIEDEYVFKKYKEECRLK